MGRKEDSEYKLKRRIDELTRELDVVKRRKRSHSYRSRDRSRERSKDRSRGRSRSRSRYYSRSKKRSRYSYSRSPSYSTRSSGSSGSRYTPEYKKDRSRSYSVRRDARDSRNSSYSSGSVSSSPERSSKKKNVDRSISSEKPGNSERERSSDKSHSGAHSLPSQDKKEDKKVDGVPDGLFEMLGEEPLNNQTEELKLSEEIKIRWNLWRLKGIKPEDLTELLRKYSRANETCYLEPPVLNPELKVHLMETAKKRDGYLVKAQECSGSALVSIGNVLDMLVNELEEEIDTDRLLKYIWDAGKLILELHHRVSDARRHYIMPLLEDSKKPIVEDTVPDRCLFGDKLPEQLRAASEVEKAGKHLIKKYKKKNLNFSRPPRVYQGHPRGFYRPAGSLRTFRPFRGSHIQKRNRTPVKKYYHNNNNSNRSNKYSKGSGRSKK